MKKDHTNYQKRIAKLVRKFPDRIVAESTGDAMDARGDESLYKPSALGEAYCSISDVAAGADQPFTLTYVVGSRGIEHNETIKFWMAGQGSLGETPQMDNPDRSGFVEFQVPGSVEYERFCSPYRVLSLCDGENPSRGIVEGDMLVGPISMGIKLIKGKLLPGMEVKLTLGRHHGFRWKKLAGRKEFKVIIETTERNMRLPEPVVINICPLSPDHIDMFIPGSGNISDDVLGVVAIRDKFDNKIDYNGELHASTHDGKNIKIFVSEGLGRFTLKKNDENFRVRIQSSEDLSIYPAQSNCCGALDGKYNLYFGDMHTHDFNSTAEGYPADCYLWARDQKRLDFQALSAQVHRWIDNEKWFLMKHMAEYFLKEGSFVTFLSFEWQHSAYGDKIIHYLGNDMPYLPVDMPDYDSATKLYEEVKKSDAFIISHHPGYELNLHVPGTDWESMDTEVDRLVELWSMHGSSEGFHSDDRPLIPPYRLKGINEGLNKGCRFGFVAGSDTHTARPGGSVDDVRPYYGGLCAIWAESLTRRALYDAFYQRRSYALTGARIYLRFSINGSPMGSELPMTPALRIEMESRGTCPIKKIELVKNGNLFRIIETAELDVSLIMEEHLDAPAYFYCRVEQCDGHLAVSSPIWIG